MVFHHGMTTGLLANVIGGPSGSPVPLEDLGGVTTDLEFWFRADMGVATTGSDVDSWTDQQQGIVAVPIAAGREPIFEAAGLGGKPCLFFDQTGATYKGLQDNSGTFPVLDGTETGCTMMGVFDITGNQNSSTITVLAPALQSVRLRMLSTPTWQVFGQSTTNVYEGFEAYAEGPHIMTVRIDLPGSGDELQIRHNDEVFDTAAATGTTLGSDEGVFMRGSSLSGNETRMAEAAFWSRALTAQEMTDVYEYFAARYGITL